MTSIVALDARAIEARAQAIAVEQSVEMPLSAIEDQQVLDEIVGRVEDISALSPGLYAVRIALSRATVGDDAGQLMNMLFGNTSIHSKANWIPAAVPACCTCARRLATASALPSLAT